MDSPTTDLYKREVTMDTTRANFIALLLSLPILLVLIIPFIFLNTETFEAAVLKSQVKFWASPPGVILILIVMAGGVALHELLHGITFAIFAKAGFRSVKFGIIRKSLTPYCHCDEPLKAWQYRLSSLMPAIVMGFIPSIIAILNGNIALILFGCFFTIAAAGDFIIVYLLRAEKSETLVQDHPEKIGCYVFSPWQFVSKKSDK